MNDLIPIYIRITIIFEKKNMAYKQNSALEKNGKLRIRLR